MSKRPKLVAFTPERGRRIRKNSGGVHTSIIQGNQRPRGSGGSSSVQLVETPSTIAQNASASCTIYRIISGTPTSQTDTITVINPWPFTIPAGMRVLATQDTFGDWYAVHPGVTDVRWVDPDLQQTRNGSSYTNIDTAVDCP